MATFDLEEQEQISELKTWWRLYGNYVTGVFMAAALAAAGWQGWNWYQRNQAAEASTIYAAVQKAAAERDAKRVRDAAGELTERYAGTTYAALAALISARMQFDTGDPKTAKLQLQWVADKGNSAELRDLARLRLAHILFDEKALDEALKLVGSEPSPAFAGRYAELRGDLLLAQSKPDEARAAYAAALAKAGEGGAGAAAGGEASYRDMLKVKLDALGGAK